MRSASSLPPGMRKCLGFGIIDMKQQFQQAQNSSKISWEDILCSVDDANIRLQHAATIKVGGCPVWIMLNHRILWFCTSWLPMPSWIGGRGWSSTCDNHHDVSPIKWWPNGDYPCSHMPFNLFVYRNPHRTGTNIPVEQDELNTCRLENPMPVNYTLW